MPTLNEALERANQNLTQLMQLIIAGQSEYHAQHGCYFQGLPTHTAPPWYDHGVFGNNQADAWERTPTDQAETWADVFPNLPQKLPVLLNLTPYRTATGAGYKVTAAIRYNGQAWARTIALGADAIAESHDWQRANHWDA